MISDQINKLFINTGNVITCKDLNVRVTQSPTEEVAEILKYTLHSWVEKTGTETAEASNGSRIISSKCATKVDREDRINLKLTVKVFLRTPSTESLQEAIDRVMFHMDVSLVDSVIMALPDIQAPLDLGVIKPLWQVLEQLVHEGKVVTIGISDLNTLQLTELYNWAQVKPTVNQVNLESCCVMPVEMTAFAKENDIQLLTHNDPKVSDLIPQEMIQKLFEPVVPSPLLWKASWMVRYSVLVKCRGIIQNKGYLLCTSRKTAS